MEESWVAYTHLLTRSEPVLCNQGAQNLGAYISNWQLRALQKAFKALLRYPEVGVSNDLLVQEKFVLTEGIIVSLSRQLARCVKKLRVDGQEFGQWCAPSWAMRYAP